MGTEIKSCGVHGCSADSKSSPYLFFIKVPNNSTRRLGWCDAMGLAYRKGQLYCCTRHFDIPADFDTENNSDKSSGVRLKLKQNVLPHKNAPFPMEYKNIYVLFDDMKAHGKIENKINYILPAIENDLKIPVPLSVKQMVIDKLNRFVSEKVNEYFTKTEIKSKFQLVKYLKDHRDIIAEIANETIVKGTLQSTIALRTIQPFLQYDAYGSLDLPLNHKQLEQLYFVCESTTLKAYFRPPYKSLPIQNDNIVFKNVFYTPGIRVSLTLPFLELTREVVSNTERYIVGSNSKLKESETCANVMDKYQKVDKPYRLKNIKVNQNLTLEYLDILINLFDSYEFQMSQRHRLTLIFLLKQIRCEMSDYEMKELQITYGYLLSKYKYYRIINEEVSADIGEEEYYMYVKEVINPELNFQLHNAVHTDSGFIEKIEQYYKPIIDYVNGDSDPKCKDAYLKFADMLKKVIVYTCHDCINSFDSILSHLTVQEHRFTVVKEWKCTNCESVFSEHSIAGNMWQHNCSKS